MECTLLYITKHYCTLPHITVHYCTLLYIIVHYCTLLQLLYITVHYSTLLHITLHYCTLLHITVHYCTLLHITVQLPCPTFKFLNITKYHKISAGPQGYFVFGYGGPDFDRTAREDTCVGNCEEVGSKRRSTVVTF
jgi:hypothetical protein